MKERLQAYVEQIGQALDTYLSYVGHTGRETLIEAMRYSALNGGKRLRPILTLEFCRVCGGDIEQALPFACALEMIHTYSLIHDDLPCMDNDDLRHGKPTNHKVFGEGMAVLAGDALLTYAFEIASCDNAGLDPKIALRAVTALAQEAGCCGMIGGQAMDLEAVNGGLPDEQTVEMIDLKTGALIHAAARMGCIVGGATKEQMRAALVYAERVGLAFQIQDDILDIEGDEAVFGKPIGSDEKSGKATFPVIFGMEPCKKMVRDLTEEAKQMACVFPDSEFLVALAEYLATREK